MELFSFSVAQAIQAGFLWAAASLPAEPPQAQPEHGREARTENGVEIQPETRLEALRRTPEAPASAAERARTMPVLAADFENAQSGSDAGVGGARTQDSPRPESRVPRSMEDLAIDVENFDALGFVRNSRAISREQFSTSRGPATVSVFPYPSSSTSNCFVIEVEVATPTPFFEFFVAQTPHSTPQGPVPMLVLFHEFGRTHRAALTTTEFFEEVCARGWFMVSPLGASTKHFSSIESQINTEVVLEWMIERFPAKIDPDRIYGVGFSMGGGAVTNYAARHLDPDKPMLAGVIALSGAPSQKDVYRKESPGIRFIFDFWFGDGTPDSADDWKMERSSCVSFNQSTTELEPVEHLGQNLLHIPTRLWLAEFDPIPYVNVQNDVLSSYLASIGAPITYTLVVGSSEHSWDLMPPSDALDWFDPLRRVIPTSGRTVADQDGYYYHFLVEQEEMGVFTPFEWDIDSAANTIEVIGSSNLLRYTLDMDRLSLSLENSLFVHFEAADLKADSARFVNFPDFPHDVKRDGVSIAIGNGWDYFPATDELTIDETDAALHVWEIVP